MSFSSKTVINDASFENLVSVKVSIDANSLSDVLRRMNSMINAHGRFLENLQKTFATKQDLQHGLKETKKVCVDMVDEKMMLVTNRMDEIDKKSKEIEVVTEKLERDVEAHYTETQERFADFDRETNERFKDVLDRTNDLNSQTDKIRRNAALETEKLDNMYELFQIPRKEVNDMMRVKGVQDQKKLSTVLNLPAFKAIAKDINDLDAAKTDKSTTEDIRMDVKRTQKKMQKFKDSISDLITNKVQEATREEMDQQMEPLKRELYGKLSEKANEDDMYRRLNQKAERVVVDQKADHDNMLRLFENVKKQLTDSMRELGEWGKEVQNDLDLKAYRDELETVSTKVNTQIATKEKGNFASARTMRCLSCGQTEPDYLHVTHKESFLFPGGRNVKQVLMNKMRPITAIERPRPQQVEGRDGKTYIGTPEKKFQPPNTHQPPARHISPLKSSPHKKYPKPRPSDQPEDIESALDQQLNQYQNSPRDSSLTFKMPESPRPQEEDQ